VAVARIFRKPRKAAALIPPRCTRPEAGNGHWGWNGSSEGRRSKRIAEVVSVLTSNDNELLVHPQTTSRLFGGTASSTSMTPTSPLTCVRNVSRLRDQLPTGPMFTATIAATNTIGAATRTRCRASGISSAAVLRVSIQRHKRKSSSRKPETAAPPRAWNAVTGPGSSPSAATISAPLPSASETFAAAPCNQGPTARRSAAMPANAR
jgi:hypothetical protein